MCTGTCPTGRVRWGAAFRSQFSPCTVGFRDWSHSSAWAVNDFYLRWALSHPLPFLWRSKASVAANICLGLHLPRANSNLQPVADVNEMYCFPLHAHGTGRGSAQFLVWSCCMKCLQVIKDRFLPWLLATPGRPHPEYQSAGLELVSVAAQTIPSPKTQAEDKKH